MFAGKPLQILARRRPVAPQMTHPIFEGDRLVGELVRRVQLGESLGVMLQQRSLGDRVGGRGVDRGNTLLRRAAGPAPAVLQVDHHQLDENPAPFGRIGRPGHLGQEVLDPRLAVRQPGRFKAIAQRINVGR